METRDIQTICLSILTILALGAALHFLRIVFLPLFIAGLLALMLTPLVQRMEKFYIPRILGIFLVMCALFILFFAVGRLFYTSLQTFTERFGDYQKRFVSILNSLWEQFNIPQEFFPKFTWTGDVVNRIVQVTGSFVSFGTNLGLVLLFLVFMLTETPLSWRKLRRAFPERINSRVGDAFADVNLQLARFLAVKIIISAITGILVWVTLIIVGQDLAVLWGMLAFLLNFIPNLGSFIIIIATMAMSFAQFFPEWNLIIPVWIAMPGIQLLMGNILDPMIQGDRLDLSPLVILISLVLWGWIWGIPGMFLAVPLTVTLKIVLASIPDTRPIAIMMGSGKMSQSFRRQWRKRMKHKTNNSISE